LRVTRTTTLEPSEQRVQEISIAKNCSAGFELGYKQFFKHRCINGTVDRMPKIIIYSDYAKHHLVDSGF